VERLRCTRCRCETADPDEIAAGWYVVAGEVVCATCSTLEDLRAVQDEHTGLECVGCGVFRDRGGDIWCGYLLTPEQAGRALISAPDGEVVFVCPGCEPWVLAGVLDA
jgi:hypothetical protein